MPNFVGSGDEEDIQEEKIITDPFTEEVTIELNLQGLEVGQLVQGRKKA